MEQWVLTLMIFIPILGMLVILCLPSNAHGLIRSAALAFTVPPLLMAIWLFMDFDRTTTDMQYVVNVPWIPAFDIYYFVGIDGVSVTMVLLTALLCFLCIPASFGIEKAPKAFFALFLLLDAGMMGVFCALDFFLFFIFWEVMLLPMYFLIGVWGGPRREYAAIKFFLYTLIGSALMLIAMLALYFASDPHTFDLTKLAAAGASFSTQPIGLWPFSSLGWGFQHLCWIGLFIGFAIKIPAFPFH